MRRDDLCDGGRLDELPADSLETLAALLLLLGELRGVG